MDAAGRFLPYWYIEGGAVKLKPNSGMETMDYYQGPKAAVARTGKAAPYITEPYEYEGVKMVSHIFPLVIQGKFAGIAGVDRGLATLAEISKHIKEESSAEVFVLSAEGSFIAATTDGTEGADALRERAIASTPYAPIAARWKSGSDAVQVFEQVDPVLKEMCFYAVAPVSTGGWTVVTRRTQSEVMAAANAAVVRNVVLGTLSLLVAAGLMLAVTRAVAGRARLAAEAADRIARGDLTQPVIESSSRDETGQLMRSMRTMDGNLNTLVGSVKQAGIRINSTATEIAATAKQQEASASTFGAASSQIAAAVKEISATGKDLVKTMESVSENAVETANLAGVGRTGLQGMESVMRDLDRATTSIAEKLGAINERSQKITTVITTITKVADQTNILSINAAIEAEKAGEFGSGFLVIAREIRRLADQTASATLDIEQMVEQMQAAVSSGVMEMDRFSDQVRRGVRDVASAGSQLTEIIDRVNRSTDSFKQVNESMQAQSEGAQQISEAMTSLSANAHQTMQSVQEFGRASTDLQSAISVLRQAVAQFKLKEKE
jgi:methyl-accepting chemotaxis protein